MALINFAPPHRVEESMRRKLALACVVVVSLVAGGAYVWLANRAATPQVVLDAAILAVRERALNASEVDWTTEEPKIRAMAAGATHTSDVYPAIRAMLKALNDHHSFLLVPDKASRMKTTGVAKTPPVVELKPGEIGYVDMPGFAGTNPHAGALFSEGIRADIEKLAPETRCGWIVDLRRDTGGNMWPMLAALEPFLARQQLGAFVFAKGNVTPWRIRTRADGNMDLQHANVAVLTGPHTASSGEAVTVAFRGRDNTRSFGLPTRGLSTANSTIDLPDGSRMLLTTAVDQDRTGRRYGNQIEPDQIVVADTQAGRDTTLAVASQWLIGSCPVDR
jgi:C-terminal processing protease CtpA/Prc